MYDERLFNQRHMRRWLDHSSGVGRRSSPMGHPDNRCITHPYLHKDKSASMDGVELIDERIVSCLTEMMYTAQVFRI